MRSMCRLLLLRDVQNLKIIAMLVGITMILSFVERVPELTLLIMIVLISGIYAGNKVEREKANILENLFPITIEKQVQSKYILLFLKVIVACLVYILVYYGVYLKIDYLFFEELILFIILSTSLGIVSVYRDMLRENLNKFVYFFIQLVLLFEVSIIELTNDYFYLNLTNANILFLNFSINFIFSLLVYFLTIKGVTGKKGKTL
ncbi:hypothetical protein [Streptococcus devriesei]|uniref:hypothetical protein n=1 Tax=Streptococcus devriesei TaxID=231233 RepID=UPI00041A11A4|nr:hypothetical protein [Streptococcus devriesei]